MAQNKSDKEILLECSSGVALAVNTSRTGYITREELSNFFQSVNKAYNIPDAKQAGEKRADDILKQVGTDITSVPAAKLKRICLKLNIDISNFLEKADYVRSVVAVSGSARVVPLFSLSAWLHQTFNGHPEKLQRIQDIALDHLVQHTRSTGSSATSSSTSSSPSSTKAEGSGMNSSRPSSASESSEYSGTSWNQSAQNSKSPVNTSGEYSSSGNTRPFSTSPSGIPPKVQQRTAGVGGGASSSSSSTSTSSSPGPDTPRTTHRKKHARRRTMVALDVFSKLDRKQVGSVSRRDFLLACRKDKEVASFLGLPQKISQEGDSREKLENVFQGIGSEGDTVTIDQFVEHFRRTGISEKV